MQASTVASHGLSSCAGHLGSVVLTQYLWLTDLVTLPYVGSSLIRDGTRMSCIGRQILHHWHTWEVQVLVFCFFFFKFYIFISTFYLKNFSPTEKCSGSSVNTLTPFTWIHQLLTQPCLFSFLYRFFSLNCLKVSCRHHDISSLKRYINT